MEEVTALDIVHEELISPPEIPAYAFDDTGETATRKMGGNIIVAPGSFAKRHENEARLIVESHYDRQGYPKNDVAYHMAMRANKELSDKLEEQRKENERKAAMLFIPDTIEGTGEHSDYLRRKSDESSSITYIPASKDEDVTILMRMIDIEAALNLETKLILADQLQNQNKSIPELLRPEQDLKFYRQDLKRAYEQAKLDYIELKEVA